MICILGTKIGALFQITRPINSVTAGFGSIAILFLAIASSNTQLAMEFFILVPLTAYLTSAFSMVQNDIIDIEIDKINSPYRVLPTGRLSLTEARIYGVLLFIMALSFCIWLDTLLEFEIPLAIIWYGITVIIINLYNTKLKKRGFIGNFSVGALMWFQFVMADLTFNSTITLLPIVVGSYVLFLNIGREIIKDIIDIEGDREAGVSSLVINYGSLKSSYIGGLFLGISVFITIPLFLYSNLSPFVLVYFFITDLYIVFMGFRLVRKPTSIIAFETKKQIMRIMLGTVILLIIDLVLL